MKWEEYQHHIAELFRRLPGATVVEDPPGVIGNISGEPRQIDVRVTLPLSVELASDIRVTLSLNMIVDAKHHAVPVDINYVEQLDGMRRDVGADVVVIASESGFTSGAKRMALGTSVMLLTATSDLLALLASFGIPWGSDCVLPCIDDMVVDWTTPGATGVAHGRCEHCGLLHLLCPDCGIVFAVTNGELNLALRCPGGCRRHFVVTLNGDDVLIESHDKLDSMLLLAARSNTTQRISTGKVQRIVEKTKMQHWIESKPTKRIENAGLMEWTTTSLSLTAAGVARAAMLEDAAEPLHDERLPDTEAIKAMLEKYN